MNYAEFLERKSQLGSGHGFVAKHLPDWLFGFQEHLCRWALRQGRSGIFADCGLGKTPMQLAWADAIVRRENKPVLILTPLAVGQQTQREGEKFGIETFRSSGEIPNSHKIFITNYEKLHHFNPPDFVGVVCDESSILKSFDGVTRASVTEFMRTIPYRLLCTATAAPNDYVELGTSSEALGEMGHMDMLNRFFVNNNNTSDTKGHWRGFHAPRIWEGKQWRFKGHAERAFWKWVCSWARACRRPSDLGFNDDAFILPPLVEKEFVVETRTCAPGMLFAVPATNMFEEREERRRTIQERCEMAAKLVSEVTGPSVVWCHLNSEGDLLEKLIPESRQISGSKSDEEREETYIAFSKCQMEKIIIKPKIGAWGLNWQHCSHIVTFASHSFEQYYQAVRRCWRFGQTRPVHVDLVVTEGELGVKENLKRKGAAADRMFSELVACMNDAMKIDRSLVFDKEMEVPSWA